MRADLDRLLHKLLHDLRTPLGVAHGYLRLLQEGRLPTEAERDKALTGTRNALGRMTEICQDASGALEGTSVVADAGVPVTELVGAVRTQLNLVGAALTVGDLPAHGRVRLPVDLDRLADAAAVVISVSARARSASALRVEADARTLSFVLTDSAASAPGESVVLRFPLENPSE